MSRKVYFTSEQLKHIMGEGDMGGYLDNTSMGSEYPVDSIPATDGEVIPTEPGGDTRTADVYAKNKIANNQWTRRGAGYSLYEHNKKKTNQNKIDENWKGTLLGTAMGAASLFGSPQQVNAQTTQMHQGNDTIGYNIRYGDGTQKQVWQNDFTPDEWNFHKKYFNKQLNRKILTPQELKKLCPAAYKDRNNPNVWEKNQNKYVFNNPDGTINIKGKIAASRGQNPWESIVGGESTVEPVIDEPIRIDADTMIKESPTKINKHLNERNAELDGKKLYSLPSEVRAFATPDGEHDDIMKRLRSGEQMDLPSLYRLRNELNNSSNTKIKNAINSTIKRAQMQGDALRNVHSNIQAGLEQPKSAIPGKGHRKEGNTKIYYENN